MGVLCNKTSSQTNTEVVLDKEFFIQQNNSQFEKFFQRFDSKFNVLKDLPLTDFVMQLSNFKFNNSNTVSSINGVSSSPGKLRILDEECNEQSCLSFFRYKVLFNHLIKNENYSELKNQIFIDFIKFYLRSVCKGYTSFLKNHSTTLNAKKKMIKKFYVLGIGLLHCHSDNLTKIGILFDVMSNDAYKLEQSPTFEDFIITLILIASYSNFKGILDTKKYYPDRITMLSDEDQLKLLELYSPEKIIKLKDFFFREVFGDVVGDSTQLNFFEFKERLSASSTGWIFHPNCIRYNLDNI